MLRRLLPLLILLALPSSARAVTVIESTCAGGTGATETCSFTPAAAGDMLVIELASWSAGFTSGDLSASGYTFAVDVAGQSDNNNGTYLTFARAFSVPSGAATITLTNPDLGNYIGAILFDVSTTPTALDQEASTFYNSGATGSVPTSPSITTTAVSEIIFIGADGYPNSGSISSGPSGGFGPAGDYSFDGGTSGTGAGVDMYASYQVVSSTGTYQGSWTTTWPNGESYASNIASYKLPVVATGLKGFFWQP